MSGTTEKLRGELGFVYDDGKEVSAEVDAVVWEMKSMDFILGLPDLIRLLVDSPVSCVVIEFDCRRSQS